MTTQTLDEALTLTADGDGLTIDYMHDTNFVDIRPY